MAELHFEFVSPERVLFSGDVDQVDLPGAEGDMGILAGHAPLVTTLRPGIVTVFRGGAREAIVVTGGFAEVGPSGLTVLADRAVARADLQIRPDAVAWSYPPWFAVPRSGRHLMLRRGFGPLLAIFTCLLPAARA